MSLWTLLDNAARTWGDRPAVSVGRTVQRTYAGMARDAAGLAAGIAGLGARRGDRIVLAMSNHPVYLTILFACWRAGLAAVPVNARLHAQEIADIAADMDARLCLATSDLSHGLAARLSCTVIDVSDARFDRLMAAEPKAPAAVSPDEVAWIFMTSGTTGKPKGAMLTHRNLMAMTVSYLADVESVTDHAALLHLSAQSHASGLFGLSFVARGARHVMPAAGSYDAGEFAHLIAEMPGLSVFAAPTLLRRMVDDPGIRRAPVDQMGTILTGAMPVYARDIKAALSVFGPRLWNGYGQGESPCTITHMTGRMLAEAMAEGRDDRLISVGVPRTGTAVRLTAADGAPVADGEVGEIRVRGETVMAGYWQRPDATADTLVEGWLRTGDLGRVDERGFLSLVGRSKEVIISGGMNVYPREVEDVLLAQAGVADVAVVGLPHAQWGEQVTAVIVPQSGAKPTIAQLDQGCLDQIARFKRPRQYVFLDSLPRNATGKVLKDSLIRSISGSDSD